MAYQYRKQHRRPRPSTKTRFWYIGKRNKNTEIIYLLIFAVLVGGGVWSSFSSGIQVMVVVLAVLLVVFVGLAAFLLMRLATVRQRARLRALTAADVDHMNPYQFEHYVAELLRHQGYAQVQVTQASGDYGVDITAEKGGQKWAVQAKRYHGSVAQEAIREAVAGCNYYHCQRSMVVTTAYFTAHAKALAVANNTTLIDRDQLADWIASFQAI